MQHPARIEFLQSKEIAAEEVHIAEPPLTPSGHVGIIADS